MSFSTFSEDEDDIMSEINMTPLVDVMLVLLIIFMITVPVIQHSVKLDLPKAANQVYDQRPPHVKVSIQADGSLLWNGAAIDMAQLSEKIAAAVATDPQPELHLYADRTTLYEHVAKVMATAQSQGMKKIGFVTEPENRP